MCVAAGVGKEPEQEYIYSYKAKLFAVHLKRTQHCKLTIVQFF